MRIMKKQYLNPETQTIRVESYALLIPASDPGEPHLVPKGHYVPGPGANYAPPAKII